MNNQNRIVVTGTIALIQESRFVLITDEGKSLLLTLSTGVSNGPQRVQQAYRERWGMTVTYSGEPGLADAIAHSVEYSELTC